MSEKSLPPESATGPMAWYIDGAGRQQGPVRISDLQTFHGQGLVVDTTMVWSEGMEKWETLASHFPWARAAPGGAGPGLPAPAIPGYTPTNGNAIASLVLGISALVLMAFCFLGIFAAVPAVVCGHIALRQIAGNWNLQAGRGMAIGGLVTGYLAILATLAGAVFFGIVIFSAGMGSVSP